MYDPPLELLIQGIQPFRDFHFEFRKNSVEIFDHSTSSSIIIPRHFYPLVLDIANDIRYYDAVKLMILNDPNVCPPTRMPKQEVDFLREVLPQTTVIAAFVTLASSYRHRLS